jgi:hypothetical protein
MGRGIVFVLALVTLIAWGSSASHAITVAAPRALNAAEAEHRLVTPAYYYRRYYRPYYRPYYGYYRPYHYYRPYYYRPYRPYVYRPYYYRRYWW